MQFYRFIEINQSAYGFFRFIDEMLYYPLEFTRYGMNFHYCNYCNVQYRLVKKHPLKNVTIYT